MIGEFNIYAKVYDFGARVNKLVIKLDKKINASSVDNDTFEIETKNKTTIYIDNGKREIQKVSVIDSRDDKEELGSFIVIELKTELKTRYSDVIVWDEDNFTSLLIDIKYKIIQKKIIRDIDDNEIFFKYKQKKFITEFLDEFRYGKSLDDINYRYYKPLNDGKKHPLIIWLHGAGEGGYNNITHISVNKGVTAFMSEKIKNLFSNPHILAPQSPNYWIAEFKVDDRILLGYDNTENLIKLIEEYIRNNNVDRSRVYIGGCSMGGYQTLKILSHRSDIFAAAFPICVALEIKREELQKIENIPIWTFHAICDDVIPVINTQNLYMNLKLINRDIKYTEYYDVYIDEEKFASHASWIYPLKNEAYTKGGVSFFEWLSSKSRLI